ncbi:MAG TPA: hypothetical protein VEK38_01265 [Candidatus Bathyarchaeia archaeon]|nr:hypothetical protein [Candidatus Bathyarchaeia archaeon]
MNFYKIFVITCVSFVAVGLFASEKDGVSEHWEVSDEQLALIIEDGKINMTSSFADAYLGGKFTFHDDGTISFPLRKSSPIILTKEKFAQEISDMEKYIAHCGSPNKRISELGPMYGGLPNMLGLFVFEKAEDAINKWYLAGVAATYVVLSQLEKQGYGKVSNILGDQHAELCKFVYDEMDNLAEEQKKIKKKEINKLLQKTEDIIKERRKTYVEGLREGKEEWLKGNLPFKRLYQKQEIDYQRALLQGSRTEQK